jgi:adenylate cyclase
MFPFRNFNTNLKYLNLSGNKRLQIKAESSSSSVRTGKHFQVSTTPMLSGFTSLHQLKVLGLMDVTITNTSQDATVDIPDENIDRRVRTSLSTVCGMGYGIADSMGKHDTLTMVDLVHEFHGRQDEALFAMFGRTHPPKHLPQGASPNRLTKYLHDNFVSVFKTQLAAVNNKQEKEGVPHHQRKEGIPKALVWTFLKLNQDLWEVLQTTRKNSQVSLNKPHTIESAYSRTGVSCVAVYFFDRTLYAANVGNALAIGSRQGVYHEISRKHDPFDRNETIRIRSAEGSISPSGLVNDDAEAKVSRSFGYYHLFPAINARPDILIYDLSDMDEFIIIANSGLWDFVPYQTAVDIARSVIRTDRPDPMLAAQKLRDFAISYGADGSVMIMVVWVADLFNTPSRSRQPTLDPILDQSYRRRRPEDQRPGFKFLDYEIPAPTGHVTLVFTDIRNSTHLWEANPGMPTAMRLHNTLLRRQLRLCGGYEVKTEGDSFMCSFPTTLAAVWWCLTVQVQLLNEPWPLEILECEDGKPIYDPEGRLIACGLSVRMGIHSGMPLCEPDLITHRMDYFGPMVNRSARIESNALGGQISCSNDIIREINARVSEIEEETEYSKLQNPNAIEGIRDIGLVIIPVGEVKLKGIELPEILSIIYPSGLEGRHDLKDAPVDPTASASRIQFSVPQIQELGMLCLRIEALSTKRLFKPLPERKNSTQSNVEFEASVDNSHIFYSDPNLLLPPINYNSTDAELMRVLDSLSLRIANAINTVCEQYQVAPAEPAVPAITKDTLMAALLTDGFLDEETLRYIATKLD